MEKTPKLRSRTTKSYLHNRLKHIKPDLRPFYSKNASQSPAEVTLLVNFFGAAGSNNRLCALGCWVQSRVYEGFTQRPLGSSVWDYLIAF